MGIFMPFPFDATVYYPLTVSDMVLECCWRHWNVANSFVFKWAALNCFSNL